jgi:hypothetical protein
MNSRIPLTKNGTANISEEETFTKPRTLYLAGILGVNTSGIAQGFSGSENADGWGLSPVLAVRGEFSVKNPLSVIADLGYEQNRAYLQNIQSGREAGKAVLRTDYLMFRAMFSYSYSFARVLRQVKFLQPLASYLRPFIGKLQAGIFAKMPLSAQLQLIKGEGGAEIPNDTYFDAKKLTSGLSGGLMTGLGIELQWTRIIFFFETQYFRGLLTSHDSLDNSPFHFEKFSEHGIYVSSGAKMGIYNW